MRGSKEEGVGGGRRWRKGVVVVVEGGKEGRRIGIGRRREEKKRKRKASLGDGDGSGWRQTAPASHCRQQAKEEECMAGCGAKPRTREKRSCCPGLASTTYCECATAAASARMGPAIVCLPAASQPACQHPSPNEIQRGKLAGWHGWPIDLTAGMSAWAAGGHGWEKGGTGHDGRLRALAVAETPWAPRHICAPHPERTLGHEVNGEPLGRGGARKAAQIFTRMLLCVDLQAVGQKSGQNDGGAKGATPCRKVQKL